MKYRPCVVAQKLWINVKEIYKLINEHKLKTPIYMWSSNIYWLRNNYVLDDNDILIIKQILCNETNNQQWTKG